MLQPEARFNVFYGDNGHGKTNLLETIYVVGALRSFRTHRLAEMIMFGEESSYIAARLARDGLERVYELHLQPRGRKIRLDGKAVRPLSKYFGDFNVVLFAPEDLQLPRGAPAARRKFLDRAVFNRSPEHLADVQAYEKTLKNRNALLRELTMRSKPSQDRQQLLDVFDEQLAGLGARLISNRIRFLNDIRQGFQSAFAKITHTGLDVDVQYQQNFDLDSVGVPERIAEEFLLQLQQHRTRDLARGSTTVGPHRDDVSFVLADRLAASHASQGQTRALILAWKTAEMDLLTSTRGEAPILLLDDVTSELDATRNAFLFEFLAQRSTQCFITTTHPDHILIRSERSDYQVKDGIVTPQTVMK